MGSLQKQYYFCNIVLVVIVLLAVSGCARRRPSVEAPVQRPPAQHPAQHPAPAPQYKVPSAVPRPSEPLIRIGLKTDSKSVTVTCDHSVQFTDGSRTRSVDSTVLASVSFVTTNAPKYFVQIGSYSTRENAERAQSRLKTGYPSVIYQNPDLNQFQLRLGPFPDQDRAQQVVDELKSQSIQGFYLSDTQTVERLPDLIIRNELGEVLLRTNQRVELWCGNKEPVSVDTFPYRGYLSVFVNTSARLTVLNVLNFEDYLKGVVPNEIGPASDTTYEALKAQAVAARTYAYKNLRQFEDQGYDICATPRCQVYSGYKTENPLTSRAVEETNGQILEYNGQPINALYTSTCGGRTENAEYMFEGWNYPYLKSVECYPEEEKVAAHSVQIQGRKESWDRAWLDLKTGIQTANNPEAPATTQEMQQAMSLLLSSLGKTSCAAVPLTTNHWDDVGEFVVSSLCWQKKRDSLLDRKDYQYFVNRLSIPVASTRESQSLLFLLHDQIVDLPEEERSFDLKNPMKRKFFWEIFFNVLKHYHQVNTSDGMVREVTQNNLQIVDDVGVHAYNFNPNFYLYQKFGDTISAHSSLNCAPGDQVQFLLDDQQKISLLVCEVNPSGISADRSSKLTFWQENVTPSELGKRVSKYLDVGDVVDLQPLSYGLSQRVYEMRITGTRGSGTLRGIRVRWALGLKDNLFVIDRTLDRSGKVKEFVFTGRGWGHGVGMCQVGAIGFARQGKNYDWILKHYYTGVTIKREY